LNFKNEDIVLVNKQYGKWNAVLTKHDKFRYVFFQNHSKIFPESLDDWVNALKEAYFNSALKPVRLDIDITNSCSNNCIMCFAKELRAKNNTYISVDKLINIFNNFKNLGGKSVRLTGGGDPLNHPEIINIIEVLSSLGLKITIETNGDLLSPEVGQAIAKFVHHLRVSVDAADNDSRSLVHRANNPKFNYDNLIKKIKYTKNKADELGRNEELFLGATFVALPENYLVIDKFVADMYDLGVNWVALRKNIHREVYEKNPQIIPVLEKQIKQIKKGYYKNPVNFTIEEQYGVSFSPDQDFDTCWVSHIRHIVLADSSLQLCCLARNNLIPEANIGILPASKEPFTEISFANAELINNFRKSVPSKCPFCIDKDNNISFSNIISLLKMNKNIAFVKANVYLGNDKNIFLNNDKIWQISLDQAQYNLFKTGAITKLE
jgi:MoaA/NifB/PqqE/SkfB family radical SAM enzyme